MQRLSERTNREILAYQSGVVAAIQVPDGETVDDTDEETEEDVFEDVSVLEVDEVSGHTNGPSAQTPIMSIRIYNV